MARIFIVDDEPAIADAARYALEQEGFEVMIFHQGKPAISLLRSGAEACHAVILDVGLPDGSGYDFCREIRGFSGVPVLFLTARSDEIDKVVGLEIGADDYMVKPFSPRELAARIKAILRRSVSAVEAVPAPPFSFDENRRQVKYFGRALDLSRYEYNLLKVLHSRPGWIFTRAQLMEQAWEEENVAFDRTIDAHIKLLRGKMREVSEIDPIITRRGVGYGLREDWP